MTPAADLAAKYRALAEDAMRKYPLLDPARVERALLILAAHTITRARHDEQGQDLPATSAAWAVKSPAKAENTVEVWHIVRPTAQPEHKRCTCYDSAEGRHICKHRIAVYLYTELPRRQFAQAAQPARRNAAEINRELGFA